MVLLSTAYIAIQSMKIYTKSGDQGQTSLVSGRRVDKSELVLESYGTVDELNAFIGLLLSKIVDQDQAKNLLYIQNILFNIGSVLAQDGAEFPNYPGVNVDHVNVIEGMIDYCDKDLPKLTNFVLPGGSEAIALTHVCRTVCRRAERRVVALDTDTTTHQVIIQFLNRLSDYFFVLGRYIMLQEGRNEIIWNPKP